MRLDSCGGSNSLCDVHIYTFVQALGAVALCSEHAFEEPFEPPKPLVPLGRKTFRFGKRRQSSRVARNAIRRGMVGSILIQRYRSVSLQ